MNPAFPFSEYLLAAEWPFRTASKDFHDLDENGNYELFQLSYSFQWNTSIRF